MRAHLIETTRAGVRAVRNGAPSGYLQRALRELLADLTDAGNANWLVAFAGQDLLFDYDRGIWRIFDGRVWREDRNGEAHRVAEEAVRAMTRASANLDPASMQKLATHLAKCLKRSALESLLCMAQHKLPTTSEQFDHDDNLFAVANGVIDLRSGDFRAASRKDYLIRFSGVPYQPRAAAPRWNDFLQRILKGDRELIDFVQKAIGYSMTGLTQEHAWFLLCGIGANGKSTFLRILSKLLGSYAQHAAGETFLQQKSGSSNDIAVLNGARVVTVTESDENRRLASGLIKQITGGDPITARYMYQEFFTFQPRCKVWFATNHRPRIVDNSEGMWRRVRYLPFEEVIPESERDETLHEKLIYELPGILNWAIAGARAWYEGGLPRPTAVTTATNAYRRDEDPIADFIAEQCDLGNYVEAFGPLYEAYRMFCAETGDREPLSSRGFGRRLEERGLTRGRNKGTRLRDGIRLKVIQRLAD